MAVDIVKRPERCLPPFVAVFAIGKQTVVRKKHEDAFAVRGGRGRGGRVHLLIALDPGPRRFAPPQNFAGFTVQAKCEQLATFVDHFVSPAGIHAFAPFGSCEEDQIAGDDGR